MLYVCLGTVECPATSWQSPHAGSCGSGHPGQWRRPLQYSRRFMPAVPLQYPPLAACAKGGYPSSHHYLSTATWSDATHALATCGHGASHPSAARCAATQSPALLKGAIIAACSSRLRPLFFASAPSKKHQAACYAFWRLGCWRSRANILASFSMACQASMASTSVRGGAPVRPFGVAGRRPLVGELRFRHLCLHTAGGTSGAVMRAGRACNPT